MAAALRTLGRILAVPFYRRLAIAITGIYLILFLVALRDISLGGGGVEFLTVDWTRMFARRAAFTFEPIARLTLPGITILLSPLNLLIGLLVAFLAGLNLAVTYLAFRRPQACGFNRSTGMLASFPALLAGGACCAPAVVLILGLQLSSLMVATFQILIPLSLILLLVTLKLILDRTNPELIAVGE